MAESEACPLGPTDVDAAAARGDVLALAATARWLWEQNQAHTPVVAVAIGIMLHFPDVDDTDDYETMRDMLRELTLQMADLCEIRTGSADA